jgi:hypothetical protein
MREVYLSYDRMTAFASRSEFISQHTWETTQPTGLLSSPPTLSDLEGKINTLQRQGGKIDMLFLGGLGMHYLVRRYPFQSASQQGPMPAETGDDPVVLHRDLIQSHLLEFGRFATKLNIPVIFLGSLPVDSAIIPMIPAKHGHRYLIIEMKFDSLPMFVANICRLGSLQYLLATAPNTTGPLLIRSRCTFNFFCFVVFLF